MGKAKDAMSMYMNVKHTTGIALFCAGHYYIAAVVSICICIERNNVARTM